MIPLQRVQANQPSTVGSGPFMFSLMLYLSTTSTLTMLGYCGIGAPGLGGLAWFSNEYLTSSASISLPLWNLMPCLSLKVYVLSSGVAHDSASAGTTLRSLSHCTSES